MILPYGFFVLGTTLKMRKADFCPLKHIVLTAMRRIIILPMNRKHFQNGGFLAFGNLAESQYQ